MTIAREAQAAENKHEEQVEALGRRIKERAEELAEEGQEALDNIGGKVRDQVRERPVTSLVVAGGIGLLLGLLIARRR